MALEDKYDDIKKLIDTGKEKGYLTYDQVNELIPHDVVSPEDLDDLLTTIGTQGIDVLEGPKLPSSALDKKFEEVIKYKVADSETWAYPIIAGNRVFVKDKDALTLWTID